MGPRAIPPYSLRRHAARAERGMTFLELVMVCAILLILSTAALPLARVTAKRQQEAELRIDLREMRNAIDRYKDAADRNLFQVDATTDGYPPDLETLVNGVDITLAGAGGAGIGAPIGAGAAGNAAAPATSASPFSTSSSTTSSFGQSDQSNNNAAPVTMHVRFLRKIPVDPMTGKAEWGLRSVQDDADSDAWGGQDVFDVYSLSAGTALDGTKYSDW